MAGDSHWSLVKQGAEAKLYTGAYLGQPAIMKVCLAAIIGYIYIYIYVSLRLRVQNAVPGQPCVGKLGISLVLLNFLYCNFRLWFKTP